jgi:hypothetical protein
MTEIQKMHRVNKDSFWRLGNWDLFGAWDLVIGI